MFGSKRILWGILVGSLVLTGCAKQPQFAWDRPGLTQADFNRDNYDCVQQSRVGWSAGGSGTWGLVFIAAAQADAQKQAESLYRMCMQARGYILHALPAKD